MATNLPTTPAPARVARPTPTSPAAPAGARTKPPGPRRRHGLPEQLGGELLNWPSEHRRVLEPAAPSAESTRRAAAARAPSGGRAGGAPERRVEVRGRVGELVGADAGEGVLGVGEAAAEGVVASGGERRRARARRPRAWRG